MARAPVLAAGGIVLRHARPPLIAVVCLRKRNEWVLPKGKLDHGETPREAAEREVWEETGHEVAVHEFLGTLAYDAGGRSKIVHYWRMESIGKSSRGLMDDVRAVDWLPLAAAIERLSREHERAFLANVGPLALQATASARRSPETRDAKSAASVRRRRRAIVPKPVPATSPSLVPLPHETANSIEGELVDVGVIECRATQETAPPADESEAEAPQRARTSWMRKLRSWLGRVG